MTQICINPTAVCPNVTSEDCLYLDIYAPIPSNTAPKLLKPVMVCVSFDQNIFLFFVHLMSFCFGGRFGFTEVAFGRYRFSISLDSLDLITRFPSCVSFFLSQGAAGVPGFDGRFIVNQTDV